uniref:Uncharacterized protein n=1 Tax=Anguilla anguilla TaxID=7936 RepID=A0A0E9P8I3_ANGAN
MNRHNSPLLSTVKKRPCHTLHRTQLPLWSKKKEQKNNNNDKNTKINVYNSVYLHTSLS